MQSAPNPTYICATARLARSLQNVLNQQSLAPQQKPWQTPKIFTLQQWLQELSTKAMLSNEVMADYFPTNTLNHFTEKLLWQTAIEQSLAQHELADLFDVPNLAQSAMETNRYLTEWRITDQQLNAYFISSETRQFLRWRTVFGALCKKNDALEPARILALQADVIKHTHLPLPEHMQWLGFDRITPLEQHLIDMLTARNVNVEIGQAHTKNHSLVQLSMDNINAECRAAVAWAKHHLTLNPNANLAIVSPVLANIRRLLADLLDDTFHPETLSSSQYEAPRIYDFSLGLALSKQGLVCTALNLLRLSASSKVIEQPAISALLLDVYWSDLSTLDERSLLDARIRKKLTRSFTLKQLLTLISKTNDSGLLEYIHKIQTTQQSWSKKQLPSLWVQHFNEHLNALNWSQTRPLSSHEYQAKQAWLNVLASFATLDNFIGSLSATDAVQKLQQLCNATMFQPEAGENVRIQVLGILESLVEPLSDLAKPMDGIWVIGMNDQCWPPPAMPIALLPAALQRDFQTPGASPDAQRIFAQKIHTRLCNSAAEINFSWSRKEGDRELRVSPLLSEIPPLTSPAEQIETLAEMLANPVTMQLIEDNVGPLLLPNEQLRGGSKLLETQAICPAWAFYQYRLGAKKLDEPSEGLDNITRGNLVHAVLQHFWLACKKSTTLKTLSDAALEDKISIAIDKAFHQVKDELSANLSAQMVKIEQHRLQALLRVWLALEKQRADFVVRDCEATHILNIEGLEITCRIDRIDSLEGDNLVVIDYKTGTLPALKTWADDRIYEPQLPLYTSLVLQNEQVVATCFARVNIDEPKFSGVAASPELLPNVSAFTKLKSNSPFQAFENFTALIAHWQTSLKSIVAEIKTGEASVKFEDENDLIYCDVKPLLRLPERALQFEQKKHQ